MEFVDSFDKSLAQEGPPAVFTLNHEGELELDLVRSRDFCRQNPGPYTKGWVHCVLIDKHTQWAQYALLSSPDIAIRHERASITQFESFDQCLQYVKEKREELYKRLDHIP